MRGPQSASNLCLLGLEAATERTGADELKQLDRCVVCATGAQRSSR